MNAPLTGPTWYWLAGTIALVLCAWAAVSVVAGAAWCLWVRWCRNRGHALATAAALAPCPTCGPLTYHGPTSGPCPPPGACPDCGAPEDKLCRPWCPRYAEDPGELGDEPSE